MKLEINKKQLELLQFMVLHFECDDDEEEELILQLEQNLNELGAKEALRLKSITEAQKKQPTPEW
jgi:hypothetical protein|tara:strand:- start:23 stop:217 length:195 start_codon:yes stop_codon:yes gene_type:complete